MRVALASFHLEHHLSGEAESIRNISELLTGEGFEVSIISADTQEMKDSVREKVLLKIGGLATATGRTVAGIRASGAESVLLFLPTPAVSVVGDLLARRAGVPVTVRFDALLLSGEQRCSFRELLRDPFFFLPRVIANNSIAARVTARRAAKYIVSSQYQKKQLVSLGYRDDSVEIIPNFTMLGPPAEDKAAARRFFELPETPVVTYIGHFFPVKGIDVLLEAFRRLPENTTLVLAWSGLGDADAVRRFVNDAGLASRVRFLGRVDKGKLLRASDVLALPYTNDSGTVVFPNTLLEAFAVGTPVVTTDLPTLRELVAPADAAKLVKPNEPEELARALGEVLSKPAVAKLLSESGRALHEERLSPGVLAEDYVRIF